MNRLLFFYVFFFLTACVKVPEAPVTETDLILSASVKGSNLLDLPLNIYSAELIDKQGVEQSLFRAVEINLANLSEGFHLLGRSTQLPVSKYTKLKLELRFSRNANVVVQGQVNSNIYTKELLTSRGKILGKTQESFFIEVPLISKGKTLSLNSKTSHLNILFDIQELIKQKESKDDMILEMTPRLSVREIQDSGEINIRGRITGVKGSQVVISTGGFLGDISVDTSQVKSIKRNNKNLETVSASHLMGARVAAKVFLNEEQQLIAYSMNVFSEDYKLFKGLVTEINDTHIKLLGGEISSADYLFKQNMYLSIPVESFPGQDKNLNLGKSMTFDMSALSVERASILKGPENFVVQESKGASNQITPVENDKDIFYFYYAKQLIEDINKDKSVIQEISGNPLTYVEPFTYNGVLVSDWERKAIFIGDLSTPLDEGLYRAKGFDRLAAKENIWYFSVEDLAKVSTNQDGNFFFHDVSEVNAVYALSQGSMAQFLDTTGLPMDSHEFSWPEIRISELGTKLSLVDFNIPLFDRNTDAWDKNCKTLAFTLNPISTALNDTEPRVVLQYMTGGNTNEVDEIHHFTTLEELNNWFNQQSNRLYLDKIDITGYLTSKPELESCQFDVDFVFLMLIDDKEARQIMADIVSEAGALSRLNARDSAILGALAGGIGALAVVAAVGAIMDYVKKRKSGLANLIAGESKRNRNAQIPLSIDPNSSDIQTIPVKALTEIQYESLDAETKKKIVQETGTDGKSSYVQIESEDIYAKVNKMQTANGRKIIENIKGSLTSTDRNFINFNELDAEGQKRVTALDIESEKFSADKLKASGVDFSDDTSSEKLRKSNTPVDIDSLKNFDTSKFKIPKSKGRK